jgi:2-phosphosulfolactate phosphatase
VFDDQAEFDERFDWGEDGVRRLAPVADVVVVVDVISFTTTVDVAVGRGATVYPYRQRGGPAAAFARSVGAVLAGDRDQPRPGTPYSLSPASLMAIPAGTRLVLPSPNGATLILLAAELGATVLAGCLRNAAATAAACRAQGGSVAVVGAGERWRHDRAMTGSLRPAVEDLVGAGAILAALAPTNPSPEAIAAIAAFHAALPDLGGFLAACASGNELCGQGFAADVELAAQLDVSLTVTRWIGAALTSWEL